MGGEKIVDKRKKKKEKGGKEKKREKEEKYCYKSINSFFFFVFVIFFMPRLQPYHAETPIFARSPKLSNIMTIWVTA